MTRIVTALTYRTVAVRQLRKRTVEEMHLRMAVPAEIREITSSEMRVAVRARNPDWTFETFSVYDGRYFVPVASRDGPVQGASVDRFFAGAVQNGPQPGFVRVPATDGKDGRLASLLPQSVGDNVREIVFDDAEQRSIDVRRIVAEHVLVDGNLWRPAPEPTWTVSRAAKGRDVPVLRATLDPHPDAIANFRIDRFADADRFVRSVSKALKRRYEAAEPSVMLDDAPINRNDRLDAAIFLGRRVYELCPSGWLRLMPREAILQWYDLPEDLKAAEKGEPAAADAIAGKVVRILGAIDGLILNRHGEEDRAVAKKRLFDVLSRWTDYEGGSLAVPSLAESDDQALSALMGEP